MGITQNESLEQYKLLNLDLLFWTILQFQSSSYSQKNKRSFSTNKQKIIKM